MRLAFLCSFRTISQCSNAKVMSFSETGKFLEEKMHWEHKYWGRYANKQKRLLILQEY
jgi:hypothetical protein